jgi:cephalosporin hydroxylase
MLGRLLAELGGSLAHRGKRTAAHWYAAARWGRDLRALATHFGTDKWGSHWYADRYQRHFGQRRREPLRVLEIGVGGYDDPHKGGESLRMWKAYFPRARIVGLDITDKRPHDEARITTVVGSQDDPGLLRRLSEEHGPFDIVIDDGSHINAHVIASFEVLFPLLTQRGIYAVEDTQTAYWEQFGGALPSDLASRTSMNYFKRLLDCLNHREVPRGPDFAPGYFDRHIVSMHFYHNLVFIHKGLNDEPSNLLDASK